MTRMAIGLALVLGWVSDATAATRLSCSGDGESLVITMNAARMLGRAVSCVEGRVAGAMTACASIGAYGLSRGPGGLTGFAGGWAEVTRHKGYAADVVASPAFVGFVAYAVPGQGEPRQMWSLKVDLRTKAGRLVVEPGPEGPRRVAMMTCSAQ